MRDLKNPRGEAACQRLLAMIALDTADLRRSRDHALSASSLYAEMGEPRGHVEASLVLAQVALAANKPVAADLIHACESVGLAEAETRQHLLLSKSWLAYSEGRRESERSRSGSSASATRCSGGPRASCWRAYPIFADENRPQDSRRLAQRPRQRGVAADQRQRRSTSATPDPQLAVA
jgi:hypothetical protein